MTEQTSRLAIIIDSSGAEKQADNLATALVKMTQAGERAATSAGKVTKATDEEKQSLSELLDRIDPVNAALNKLDKQQQDLAKFKSKGMVDTDTFDLYSKKIQETRNRLTGFRDDLGKNRPIRRPDCLCHAHDPGSDDRYCCRLIHRSVSVYGADAAGRAVERYVRGYYSCKLKGVSTYVMGLVNPFTVAAGGSWSSHLCCLSKSAGH